MSKELSYLNKAGRLLRLIGWLYLIVAISIAAGIIIPIINSGQIPEEFGVMILFICLIFAFSFLNLFVGSSIKQDKKWAKVTGYVIAVLSLLSVPIGTLLGIFILYYLHKGRFESKSIT